MAKTELQLYSRLSGEKKNGWLALMERSGLSASDDADCTVLAEENGFVLGAASLKRNVIRYAAVAPEAQGLGLTASLLTVLRKEAFSRGICRLFLYTKPGNRLIFEGAGFYSVAETKAVLLMENRPDGLRSFLASLPDASGDGPAGAVVMNASPFTCGHRYLLEQAASRCGRLCVFVLSEESGPIPAAVRMEMVKRGVEELPGVTVYPTGDYLISSATFPDYFLKTRSEATASQCELDCRIFADRFAPRFGICERFAGTEPFSEVTERYNRMMAELLPAAGIRFTELPRRKGENGIAISASEARRAMAAGDAAALARLVPESTLSVLGEHGLI